MRYQFQVDGRAGPSPIRVTWKEAAQDAVNAGYARWKSCGTMIVYGDWCGCSIERLPDRPASDKEGRKS